MDENIVDKKTGNSPNRHIVQSLRDVTGYHITSKKISKINSQKPQHIPQLIFEADLYCFHMENIDKS